MLSFIDPLAILGGFVVGAIVGLTGVGGGSLMTPLLISVFKLNPAIAIGTDLWFAALTKAGGSVAHWKMGHVDKRVTLLLLLGSVPATIATVAWMHATIGSNGPQAAKPFWSGTLTTALGVALLLTAISVAFRPVWQRAGNRLAAWIGEGSKRDALTVASGLTLGVLVTLSSVGAGALGATLLMLLYPRVPSQRIVGTDIAHAVPLTLIAGIGHASLGHVNWALLATLLMGSLPGIWLGAKATRKMPEGWVRSALCLSLTAAGLKVLT